MTRRNYIALADAFNRRLKSTDHPQYRMAVREVLEDISDVLYQDNSRFDYGRFVEACERDIN